MQFSNAQKFYKNTVITDTHSKYNIAIYIHILHTVVRYIIVYSYEAAIKNMLSMLDS